MFLTEYNEKETMEGFPVEVIAKINKISIEEVERYIRG